MRIATQNFGDIALIPNRAERPIKEVLEFFTDVVESYNGSEQRIQLRAIPKQSFVHVVPIPNRQWASTFISNYKALGNKCAIPVWNEAQEITSVADGATSIACETDGYDYRTNGLALLTDTCGNAQVIELGTVAEGLLSSLNPLEAMRAPTLCPLRVGKIVGNAEYETDGFSAYLNVVYDVEDITLTAHSAPTQYLSHDYYELPTLLNGGKTARSFVKKQTTFDGKIGKIEHRSSWNSTRLELAHKQSFARATEVLEFRQFLARRAGRYRDFWLPTFESNVRVKSTGSLDDTFNVWRDSLLDYANPRVNVSFLLDDGTRLNRIITNFTSIDETTIQITLNSDLNVDASRIVNCSYLGLYRMNSDRVELIWNRACDLETSFVELTP